MQQQTALSALSLLPAAGGARAPSASSTHPRPADTNATAGRRSAGGILFRD
jgi:hypothetical protein